MVDIEIISGILKDKTDVIKTDRRQAAVIMPLLLKNNNTEILFQKRADDGTIHAGQISFPGGSIEKTDGGDFLHAALRETYEEIGIKPYDIKIFGAIEPIFTLTSNFVIYPFVGLLTKDNFKINKDEVERLFSVPLNYLIGIHPFVKRKYIYKNRENETFVIEYDNEIIWGATARIIDRFIWKLKSKL